MNRSVTYHITEADASMQILDFLRSKGFFPDISFLP